MKRRCNIFYILILIETCYHMFPVVIFAKGVTLTWDMPQDNTIAGYRIFQRIANHEFDFESPVWEGVVNYATISDLDDMTIYFFVVRSYNAPGYESINSNEVSNYQPVLKSPPDKDVEQRLTPLLETELMNDSAYNDIHAFSLWQIATSPGFEPESIVMDYKTQDFLETLPVQPSIAVLRPETQYYWRIKHFDHCMSQSPWSEPFSFRTSETADAEMVSDIADSSTSGGGGCFISSILSKQSFAIH